MESSKFHITIIEARNLPPMNVNGSADSFVVIKVCNEEVYKTEVHYNTLFPKWNETVSLPIFQGDEVISINVFDYNELNDNEEIGGF